MLLMTDILLLGLVLTNFRLLASSRLRAIIDTTVLQALILSAMLLTLSQRPIPLLLWLFALFSFGIKGVVLPWLLKRAMRDVGVRREIEPLIGYTASVLIGIVLLGLCFLITSPLARSTEITSALLLPGALFTILTGLMIIILRKKALTQVVGYLAMENGVYAMGAALAVKEPLLVQMGVLLDIFVAVFVMGITVYQIGREFDHIDTDRLAELKD